MEISLPPGFSTPPQIPNIDTSERLPMTTTVFAATTPENTPSTYHASTSSNPNPMISPSFVKENYKVLESLLRERRRQICNEDLQTGPEYFRKEVEEEEMPKVVGLWRLKQGEMETGQHDTNECRQLRNQIKEAVKSRQLSHLVKGIKKEKKDINAMGIEASTIHGAIKFHTTKGVGIVFLTYESDKVKGGMKKVRDPPPQQAKSGFLAAMWQKKRESLITSIRNKQSLLEGSYQNTSKEEGDEDKTTFFAGEGVFCYRKIPFSLKNAGATYRRLVDKVFHHQIGRNLEAYVNDMVVIVCLEKVVRISLEGDEILWVQEEHGVHLKLVLELLRKEKLYAKFTKSEAVKNWEKYEWGAEREEAFQTLKNDLCDALIYQIGQMMVSTLWIKLFSEYEYEIRYHPAQSEAFKQENVLAERLHGLDQQMEKKEDESLYFIDRIWFHCDDQTQSEMDDLPRGLADTAESVRDAIRFESYVLWAEIRESSLTGLELVQEMTDKVVLVKENPKAARDHQKSYVDYRCKPLEFKVGDHVLLKVMPSCRLRLPEELSSVHDTFYVSTLKKGLADANLHVPLDEIEADKTLHFVKETEVILLVVELIKFRDEIPLSRGDYDTRDLSSYAYSDSLLLTQLCCDDIHDVIPCVSTLAGCDRETEGRPDTKSKKTEISYEWKLYTNGAASCDSSGVGIMLIDPEGKEYTYALRFGFDTTNDEAKYEVLLVGLQIALEVEITSLAIFIDLQLLVNQIKGTYVAKQPTIREYLHKTKEALKGFDSYTIEHIQRNQNLKADALRKLASMTFEHLTKEVLVEVLSKRSIEEKKILQVKTKKGESWMTPIHEHLVSFPLTEDPKESRKIGVKVPQYKLIRGSLYRRSLCTLWLRCVALKQTNDIVKEIHEGSCGFNAEPRSMVVRITKQGYYWPSMHRNATKVIQDGEKCKEQSTIRKIAENSMITTESVWPFSHWGVNILEPLPIAPGGFKFLAIVVEHSMKWVEAKPMTTISRRHAERFVWENRVPRTISSKDEKHFQEGIFAYLFKGLKERIIDYLDADEDITLVNDQEMFDADRVLQGEKVVIKQEVVADKEPIVDVAYVSAAATTVTIDDITLAKALKALKTSKPKIRGIFIKDHEEPKESRTTIISSKKSKENGKAKMIEELVKLKKKDQMLCDKEVARKLQEEINEEERLAERLQAEEQQELNKEEKAKLFMELLEKRRKFFAGKRAEEKRNRPPMKSQQRVNTFVDYTNELMEESSKKVEAEITQEESLKRAGNELEQETAKKQKIVDDKEIANLKQLVKIIPKEDIAYDDLPLVVKTLIVD
uniref:Reverse transcriptase domain-containing protein n=1 Tax=Tanacetum cinerariifolium TaxID=118510 RepID=A0A6L2J1B0_TANCI|nr:reverse transcriptase domain-containing protein [Tanacetum cinerariifolium]